MRTNLRRLTTSRGQLGGQGALFEQGKLRFERKPQLADCAGVFVRGTVFCCKEACPRNSLVLAMAAQLLRLVLFATLICFSFAGAFGAGRSVSGPITDDVSSASAIPARMHKTNVKLPPWESFIRSNITASSVDATSWDHKRAAMGGLQLQENVPPHRKRSWEGVRRKVVHRNLLPTSEGVPISAVKVPKSDTARTTFHFQPPQNWMNDPNGKRPDSAKYILGSL